MPVFIIPPLVSLTASVVAMRKSDNHAYSYEWIAIISLINLILSGLILYRFHFSPQELLAAISSVMRDGLRTIFFFLPDQPPSSPRLTPV